MHLSPGGAQPRGGAGFLPGNSGRPSTVPVWARRHLSGGYPAPGRSWMIQWLPSGSEKNTIVLHGSSLRPGTWTPFS